MIPTVWLPGKGKILEIVNRSVVPGIKQEREMNRQNTEDFQGSENTLYDTPMADIMSFYICQNLQNLDHE